MACFSGPQQSIPIALQARLGRNKRYGSWHLIRQLDIGRRLDWLRKSTRLDGHQLQIIDKADGANSEVPLPLPYSSKVSFFAESYFA